MKRKRVFLMCGIPGSGKSTWIQTQLRQKTDILISRDQIRFSLLKDNEDYFEREELVFSYFVNLIQKYIDDSMVLNVYIDATHLTTRSRNKLLNKIFGIQKVDIIPVWFNIPLNIAIERNQQRIGRAYVPKEVIRRMFMQQIPPTFSERYHYAEIWEVDKDFNIKIHTKGVNA